MLSEEEHRLKYMDNMVLVRSKDKSFEMGSENGGVDEKPVHTVSFTYNYYMDTVEVTKKDYSGLMSSSYSGYSDPYWTIGDETYPVYFVNWYDAVLYCNARSIRDGYDTVYSYTSVSGSPGNGCELNGVSVDFSEKGYRLPTEAEWEYACRAGADTDYFWGENANGSYANGGELSDWPEDGYKNTIAPVASYYTNAYGLYDMCGNMWEWCNDWYDPDYYSNSEAEDPMGPDSVVNYRALRGGAWNSGAGFLRSSNRSKYYPDTESNAFGFRCVLPD